MTKQNKAPTMVPTVRVAVDLNDSAQDREVPVDVVLVRYRFGELLYDFDSDKYFVIDEGTCPNWLSVYNKAV